jgi:hypothetical protein
MRVGIGLLPIMGAVFACSSAPKTVPSPSPTTQVMAAAGDDSVAVMLPTPRDFASSEKVKSKYDKTTDVTTESVLVQSQQYSVTKKRPGATFNFTYRGQARVAVPSTVGLMVQVTEPQEFEGNAGSYLSGGNVIELPTPAYSSVNANFGTNHVLSFQIPITDYSRMLTDSTGTLTVGGFDIPLGLGAVESMRDLGSRMGPPRK